ncbi:MAG: metallophosphoesterase [Pseudomonadales bacterium]|nr:metallophosphoesterase family protein [Pseudomonadales bacterium]
MRDSEIQQRLEKRLGPLHARQRLGIEADHEARVFSGGSSLFHLENWYSFPSLIRFSLRMTGLHQRAIRNTLDLRVVEHRVALPGLPPSLEGLRVLHLSDLHLDMNEDIVHVLIDRVRSAEYDLCVLTGDYRFRTFGEIGQTVQRLAALRASLSGDVFAVLGNHDSVTMLPAMEEMGIRVLMNESASFGEGDGRVYLAGIDDAHYYGVGNIEKSLAGIPEAAPTILLSHTPEVYRQAAHAGVHLLLCGHTHGGQICLPGGHPVILDARIPRRLGRGPWTYGNMRGYTSPGAGASILGVRLNCPPEITVHELHTEDS